MVRCLIFLLALVSLSGLAAPVVAQSYLVSVGDKLSITVFDNPDLSGDYEVDSSGSLNFPLLGTFPAAGKSVDVLTDDLTAALNKDFLVDPQVTVEVLSYQPFFMMGQVNAPGSYPYRHGMVVRQAVALAGGYTRRADPNDIVIIRLSADGSTTEIEVDESTEIKPGDTIEVYRRLF